MGLPASAPPPPPQSVQAPSVRRMKKGELLFAEGEVSRSMYLIKSGMIRIFKKKGDVAVEIDTVRSGQILGELAFLDGNPRSASAEALSEVEIIEISNVVFQQVMGKFPEWMRVLLKTIVGRLRTAGTRIRQLENTAGSLDYKEVDGRKTSSYVYINPIEFMKMSSALLLVSSRNGQVVEGGVQFRPSLMNKYANQIMGVPAAKISTFFDVLTAAGLVSDLNEVENKGLLKDINFLEKLASWLNDENLAEPEKKKNLTPKGFMILNAVSKHLDPYPADKETGIATVNLAQIKAAEKGESDKDPFTWSDCDELVNMGYLTVINLKSTDEVYTTLKPEEIKLHQRFQKARLVLQAANDQKAKTSK